MMGDAETGCLALKSSKVSLELGVTPLVLSTLANEANPQALLAHTMPQNVVYVYLLS